MLYSIQIKHILNSWRVLSKVAVKQKSFIKWWHRKYISILKVAQDV